MSQLPRDDAALTQWTYDRWYEKEAMLEHFYRHKTFLPTASPTIGSKGGASQQDLEELQRLQSSRVVQQDLLRFVILHLFFLTSTYFHYQVVVTLLRNCASLFAWWVL